MYFFAEKKLREFGASNLQSTFPPGQKRKDSRASANGVKCKPGGPLRPLRPAHNLAATYNSLVSTHTRIQKQFAQNLNQLQGQTSRSFNYIPKPCTFHCLKSFSKSKLNKYENKLLSEHEMFRQEICLFQYILAFCGVGQ